MKCASLFLMVFLSLSDVCRAQNDSSYQLQNLTREAFSYYLNNPDTTLLLTQQALEIALKEEDKYYEGYCYFIFSKTYWVKTNYKLSTEYGFKGLRIFQELDRYEELGACQLALARTLVELGNTQKAHDYIHDALQQGIDHGNIRMEAEAYREHSFLLTELNQLDSALFYADKGLKLLEKLGDSTDISVLYGRKSRIYFLKKKFNESKAYGYRALRIDSLVNNKRGLGISYYQVAQNEHALGNPKKAIAQLRHSIRLNQSLGNLTWQIKAHELLSTVYLEDRQPFLAAEELQKVSQYKDELYNSEKNGQIQEMQSLHELEAKEKTIRLLEQEYSLKQQQISNQRLFVSFLLVTVLFLILLVSVLARLRTVQDKTNRNLASKNFAIEQQKIAIQVQAENLRQLDQVKTKLFSVISHDLRGPIANLQSLLDLFTKKLMTTEEFITLSGKLRENLNLTQRTLENLLNWSLSQMGGIKTERKKIDLALSLDEAVLLLEEVALRKHIVLHKNFTSPMKVWADANQIQVVLRNLIHNAIKFSAFNGRIDILASCVDKTCQITVRDFGIGMSAEEIEALTGSKHFLSRQGTEQEKGTGLGLMLCKEFIERNEGEMSIRSIMGEGTEVSFTLVLVEPQVEMASRQN